MDLRSNLPRAATLVGAGAAGAGVALAVAIGLGGVGGESITTIREIQTPATTPASSTFGLPSRKAQSIYEIYKRTSPGVVQITATSVVTIPIDPFFPDGFIKPRVEQQRALGSGFVLDKAGHIVTNYHVVAGAKSVEVSFSSNESMKARIVGSDPSTDLAVLKVDASSRALTALILGDSDDVKVGDSVVAIGNPFGLSRSVTAGIVSALQRQITAPNQYSIDHVIQTDAAINHGNSGGPLISSAGEVIGVNAQIDTGTTGEEGNVGIGFAIPSNTVKAVAAQLIRNGKVDHAFLGISAQPITPDLARVFRLPVRNGLLVEGVQAGSSAAIAGIKGGKTQVTVAGESYTLDGDVIASADGVPVGSIARLRDLVSARKPGETMTLVVYRGDKKMTIKVKLGRQPSSPSG